MSISRLNLTRNIGKDPGLGYIQVTPSTGGSTTTVVANQAASHLDPDDANSLLYNGWLKCEADSAGTPLNVGEIRRLDSSTGYVASTATLTTTRAFSNASTTTQTYGVYVGLPPETIGLHRGIVDYINERLRNNTYKDLFLLTLATDGDMETSGTTSYSGTNATLAKVTSGAGVTQGDQALQVTTTAANGYCTMASNLDVSEGEVYEVVVDVTPTSGIWKMQTWDVTNDAEIDVTDTYAGTQPRRLWLQSSIPTDCERMNVRLIGETITTVAVFDNLSIRFRQQRRFPMPSWFIDRQWLEEVWIYPAGTERDQAYSITERNRYHPRWFGIEESYTANTPFRLEIDEIVEIPNGAHLFFAAIKPYSELSSDSATTDADQDWIKYMVLMDIYATKGDEKNLARCAAMYKSLGLQRHHPVVNRRLMTSRPV